MRLVGVKWLLFILLLAILVACKGDPETAWLKISNGALVVDVRTPDEYKEGHLSGAILIPDYEVEKHVARLGDKQRALVLYSNRGARAEKVQEWLKQQGYTDVTNGGSYQVLIGINK